MKAVVFDASIPKYLATRAAGSLSSRFVLGPGRTTRLTRVPEPGLPGRDWVRVRTRLGGICGSDVQMVRLKVSPSTSPFSSSPFVVGHENVGVIVECGSTVTGFATGDRVVANPLLNCIPRGIVPPCRHCAAGEYSRCENFTGGALPPGMLLGTTRGLGGSWGEYYVAHVSQLVRMPDSVSDRACLLLEPFASVLSPVLAHPPRAGEKTLVIGAGSVGLLAIAALAATAPGAEITVLARYAFQAEEARRLGAHHVVMAAGGREDRAAAQSDTFAELARISGAKLLKPILGPRIAIGGFDHCMVAVAGVKAIDDALRFTRSGGTVVVVGNVAGLPGVDWTPLWAKELTLHGTLCYGDRFHGGTRRHTFEVARELFAAGLGAKLESMVTHTFPLERYQDALALAFGHGDGRAVKIAFEFAER